MPLKRLLFAATSVAVVVGAASCREPTQVVIEARTNVEYKPGYVTAFTVGPHASLEGTAPTTETREPWEADGFVGSLVVVPGSGAADAALTVKLVLGVRRDARECEPPSYAGCIVARRKLRYAPHERLRLPIMLYAQCENVPCDAESTCNFLGKCVSATVDAASCQTDAGCTVEGDRPAVIPPPISDDASTPPADAAADAPADVTVEDVKAVDAASDVLSGDADAGIPGHVRCPPTTCSPAQKCCTNGGVHSCVPDNASCPQPGVTIECDGREDCNVGETCCVENDGRAKCKATTCVGVGFAELCHSSLDCSGARPCSYTNLYAVTYPTCL